MRARGNVFETLYSIMEFAGLCQHPHLCLRPAARNTVQAMRREPAQKHNRDGVQKGADEEERGEEQGTQQLHAISPVVVKGRRFAKTGCEA